MFETITQNCCDYSNGICTGGLFKLDRETGEIKHWIDNELADKFYRVTKGSTCAFFNSVVIPSIPAKQNQVLGSYQMALTRNLKSGKIKNSLPPVKMFSIKCKKCKTVFQSRSRNKMFCDDCLKHRRRSQIKANVWNHRKNR